MGKKCFIALIMTLLVTDMRGANVFELSRDGWFTLVSATPTNLILKVHEGANFSVVEDEMLTQFYQVVRRSPTRAASEGPQLLE